ncbi:MAG: hypothetical protein SGJ27_21610 [Candidatus Melainabacteria bacterium]|nr:hypothetical protein [Candidatus Melainabacteria bacterium]
MLFLCVAIGLLILALVGMAFWFQLTFFSNQLLQDTSEKVALNAAQKLNENENAGKINNLTGCARELVFSARQMHSKTVAEAAFAEYEPLAAQVLEQSRDGANLIADERQRLINSSIVNLRALVKEKSAPFGREIALFDAAVEKPRIVSFSIGSLENLESNVIASAGVPELTAYDTGHQYIKHGKDFDFYRANDPLKLPAPDDDLKFELSQLPIAVNGTSAPLRLVSESHYKPSMVLVEDGKDAIGSCAIMPSCVQVLMSVKMKSKVATQLESGTQSTSTACTNGASPDPK